MLYILRSGMAVLTGLLLLTLIVLLGTMAAASLLVPGGFGALANAWTATPLPAAYLAANLAISLLAAAAGGWMAARLALNSPLLHAAGLAVLLLLISIDSVTKPQPGQPAWYPAVVSALGVAGALAGGWLRQRKAPRRAPPVDAGPADQPA